jgi:hypothetical protein
MNSHPRTRRRGSVLIVALVCLLVIMSLLGHMLLAALRSTRQLHAERDRQQCDLLLQAGIERGRVQVDKEAIYAGETLDLAAAEIIGQGAAQITIEVLQSSNDEPRQLKVSAEYSAGTETSVRRSRTVSLPARSR